MQCRVRPPLPKEKVVGLAAKQRVKLCNILDQVHNDIVTERKRGRAGRRREERGGGGGREGKGRGGRREGWEGGKREESEGVSTSELEEECWIPKRTRHRKQFIL